jgi:hypothetical protein
MAKERYIPCLSCILKDTNQVICHFLYIDIMSIVCYSIGVIQEAFIRKGGRLCHEDVVEAVVVVVADES